MNNEVSAGTEPNNAIIDGLKRENEALRAAKLKWDQDFKDFSAMAKVRDETIVRISAERDKLKALNDELKAKAGAAIAEANRISAVLESIAAEVVKARMKV